MARTSTKTKEIKSTGKVVKTIPNSESGSGVECYTKPNQSGDKYLISQNPTKMQFTLWKYVEDGFEKITTSDNPIDLYKVVPFERQD